MILQPVTGASSQELDTDTSALCSEGLTPLNITGALLDIMRRHFSKQTYIRDAALHHLSWSQEPEDSRVDAGSGNILIEPVARVYGRPEQFMQRRPAILVKRNKWAPKKISIGDREQGHQATIMPGRTKGDYEIDTSLRMRMIVIGSHTVFCLGGSPGEAESLGTETFLEMLEFSQLIRQDMNFNQFKVGEMGAVAKLEESKEHFVIPIVLGYAFWHSWKLRPDHPMFLRYSMS